MPQSRKWQLTFNNPAEHGFTHDVITAAIENLAFIGTGVGLFKRMLNV